jgi:methylenetetrahydrofolate dehydrogenase (NADP+)/methenyltetrahydrofolate cyclohydrolase
MSAKYYDVKSFVKNWKEELRSEITIGKAAGRKPPSLTIVQIGHNEASTKYVDNKIKDCKEVGIYVDLYRIPEESGITTADLMRIVNNCETNGVIVQLPVPDSIDMNKVKESIAWEKDVDGFVDYSPYYPATPKGILAFLESQNIEGAGKVALVIGRSEIVGRPVARMLLDKDWTVIQAHSKSDTNTLNKIISEADLIVCAVGRAHFLDASMAKKDAVIIDVGTNWNGNKLVGDVYNQDTSEARITPVPGGVGLLTRCALLENVVEAWNNENL